MSDRGRRPQAGSLEGKLQAFAVASAGDIAPPAGVRFRKKHLHYWTMITRSRPRAEWTPIDLEHAAELARLFCSIETIAREIQKDGEIIEQGGRKVVNPMQRDLDLLTSRKIRLCRFLHVHASVLSGANPGDKEAQRRAEEDARNVAEGGSAEDPHGLLEPRRTIQ